MSFFINFLSNCWSGWTFKQAQTQTTEQRKQAAHVRKARVVAPPQPRDVVPHTFKPVVRVFLVRHGETNENRLGIVQGTMDTVLNEEGILQAELVAEELRTVPFACILSSDLKRCSKTAEIIAGKHPSLTVQTSAGLRERCCGEREGMPPEVYRAKKHEIKDFGEPGLDFTNRVYGWWKNTLLPQLGQSGSSDILIVSHGAWILTLLRVLASNRELLNPNQYPLEGYWNTAVGRIDLDGKGLGVLEVNNWVGHLVEHERAQRAVKKNVDEVLVPSNAKIREVQSSNVVVA